MGILRERRRHRAGALRAEIKHDMSPILTIVNQHATDLRTVQLQAELEFCSRRQLSFLGKVSCGGYATHQCRTRWRWAYWRSPGSLAGCSGQRSTCRVPWSRPEAQQKRQKLGRGSCALRHAHLVRIAHDLFRIRCKQCRDEDAIWSIEISG